MADTSEHRHHTLIDADGFPVHLATQRTPPRKRASRPPFLDLTSPLPGDRRTDGIGKGLPSDFGQSKMDAQQQPLTDQRWNARRVVTDSRAFIDSTAGEGSSRSRTVSYQQPLQHRPLPAPPMQTPRSTDTDRRGLPSFASSGMLARSEKHEVPSSNRFSLAISSSSSGNMYGMPSSSSSTYTPRTPARRVVDSNESRISPTTPGMPDPRTLNRGTLIGVGELSTPRYSQPMDGRMAGQQDESGRRMQDRGRGVPPSTSFDSSFVLGKRDRQVSGPRVRGEGKRQEDKVPERTQRGVPRLPSFGDLGTFKIPTPTSASAASPSSPGSGATAHPAQRTTPIIPHLPSTPSAHSILRQFGSTRDFSHLPPSPSSASIGKIMEKSGSMSSLAFAASEGGKKERKTPTGAGSPKKGGREDRTASMDEETREVIRRLDGLGKSSSGSLKVRRGEGDGSRRKSSSGAPVGPRSTTDDQQPFDTAETTTRYHKSSSSAAESGSSYTPGTPALPPYSALESPKVVSSGSFSGTSQTGSRDDTLSSDGSGKGLVKEVEEVPPVPPLPRSFVTKSTTMNDLSKTAAYYVPVRDEASNNTLAVPPSRISNSTSSPALGTEVFSDSEMTDILKSPALSVTSADSLAAATQAPGRPRMMSKKWSFSSALNLVSSSANRHKSDALSPGLASGTSFGTSMDGPLSPPVGYASSVLSGSEADSLAPPPLSHHSSGTSESVNTTRGPLVSSSATIVDQNGYILPSAKGSSSTARRGTTTSLPFFRRSSSNSIQAPPLVTRHTGTSKISSEQSIRHDKPAASVGVQPRKTVLGIGIPAMLGGSKRNSFTQDSLHPEQYLEDGSGGKVRHERKGSFGWGGRKRGKTPSIAPDASDANTHAARPDDMSYQYSSSRAPAKRSSFVRELGKDDKYSSMSSQRSALGHVSSHSNLPHSRSAILPTVAGSPSRSSPSHQNQRYANGSITSATPTRIPRISHKAAPSTAAQKHGTSTPSGARPQDMERKASAASYADLVITADQLKAPVTTKSRRYDSPQDLPRTEESDQVVGKAITTRRVSGPSTAKRVLPEPPANAESSAHPGLWSADRQTISNAVSSGVPLQQEKGDILKGSKSFASHLSTATGSGRVSTISAHSSASSRPPSSHASGSRSGSPGIDGDEKVGDEEMAAFFKRQRARQAKGEKMSAELEASLNFPDPADPVEAMSPHAFIKKHFDSLSLYERREILDYSTIWFSGSKSSKRATNPDASQNNYGYDDDRGDYLVNFGDHLAYRYEILGLLGKGSFGQVLQCRDHRTGECVAIKIIRNKKRFHHQALVEVRILENLVQWDPEDKHNLIKIIEKFSFRSHLCIVTELLSLNLYELVKANNFVGFSTSLIRRFTVQMLSALQVMKNNRIIHCDLKPENILLRHPAKSGIKVIDFGSSCLEDERVYTYIQSRFYRSPEIILGVKYNMAIDMWSLGCILAEMHTGFPIFPGENEQEQLACIMEVLGYPDRQLVEKGERKRVFFDSHGQPRPVTNSKGKRRRPGSKNLSAILKCDDALFVDFIAKCLIWDPERRLKPFNAMHHPWIVAGKKLKVTNQSSLPSGIQSTPRARNSKEASAITDTPTKKKSSDNLSNGRYAVQPSPVVPPSSLGSKVSSSRAAPQGMLKARISKPSPLTPKASSTTYQRSSELAPLSTPSSRVREKPVDTPSIKVRQLTGKTYRPAV